MSVFTAQAPVWRRTALNELLAALSTVPSGALLTTPKVHLLKAAVTPFNQDVLLTTLTAAEADYTGYTPINLPTLAGPLDPDTEYDGLSADVNFLPTIPISASNLIYGYFVSGITGPDWCLGEIFPTPFSIAIPGDFLALTLFFALKYQTNLSS